MHQHKDMQSREKMQIPAKVFSQLCGLREYQTLDAAGLDERAVWICLQIFAAKVHLHEEGKMQLRENVFLSQQQRFCSQLNRKLYERVAT